MNKKLVDEYFKKQEKEINELLNKNHTKEDADEMLFALKNSLKRIRESGFDDYYLSVEFL